MCATCTCVHVLLYVCVGMCYMRVHVCACCVMCVHVRVGYSVHKFKCVRVGALCLPTKVCVFMCVSVHGCVGAYVHICYCIKICVRMCLCASVCMYLCNK